MEKKLLSRKNNRLFFATFFLVGLYFIFGIQAFGIFNPFAGSALAYDVDSDITATALTVTPARDGSGNVTVSFDLNDTTTTPRTLNASVQFYPNTIGCIAGGGQSMAYLNSISSTYDTPIVNNAPTQGTSNVLNVSADSGANTITVNWLSTSSTATTTQGGGIGTSTGVYCILVLPGYQATIGVAVSTTVSLDNTVPTTPSALTINTTSTASVILGLPSTTSTDTNFLTYKIYYKVGSSGVGTGDTLFSTSTTPGDTNFDDSNFNNAVTTTITGLATGTQYVANIWAYDTFGNSTTAASEMAFYTLADTPGIITTNGVTVSTINLTLDFTTNDLLSTSTLYNVCKTDNGTSCASNGYWSIDTTLGSGPNWYTADELSQGFSTLGSLTPSTSYQFIMQAKNGDSVLSAFSTASTATTTLTAQPLSPTVNTITTTTLTLSWGDNNNPASVEYRVSGTGITTTSTITTSSLLLEGLTPNASYTIGVESKNSDGTYNAAVSTSLTYTSSTDPTSPTVASYSTSSMVLQWSTNSSATSTVYQITGDNGFTTAYVTSTATDQTVTTSVSGLSPDASYTFTIASKNNQDDTYNAISSFSATFTRANIPGAPTVTASTTTALAITIDSNSNPANTTYSIYNATSDNYLDSTGAATSSILYQTTSSWSGISASGLTVNTAYQFIITGRNGNADATDPSPSSTAVYTLANIPSSVAASASGNTITVTFTGDATSYYVVDDALSARFSDFTTTLSREFTGLTCNTSYTFKVKGKNAADTETAYSSTASATTGACASTGGGGVSSSVAPSLPAPTPPAPATVVAITLSLNTPTLVSVGGVSHTVTVSSASANQITLTIQSEPIKLTLIKGESKDIDTNNDSTNDARITYLGLVNGKPKIEIVNLTNPNELKSAVSINAGAYETSHPAVTINFNGTNIDQIAISNDSSFANSSFIPYVATIKWNLTAGNGLKTVYVKFRSKDGGTSTANDTITLNEVGGSMIVTVPDLTAITSVTKAPYKFTKTIYPGATGTAVKELQKLLKQLGYYTAKTITGKYDAHTKASVIKFQKAKKLKPYPGWVGPATMKALNVLTTISNASPVAITSVTKPTTYKFTKTIYPGATGTAVKELQNLLKQLGYYTADTITGKYDASTKAAVVKFQKVKNLKPYPGWVGPGTVKALNSL